MKNVKLDIEKFENIPDFPKAVTFFGSARLKEDSIYYKKAKELAKKCVENDFCVISGGGGGIMKAANEGAFKNKNNKTSIQSVGFNIFLPFEQKLNDFIEYNITFKSLAIRKMALIQKSLAFVIFPGGFGTLDELCEIITLKQLKFKENVPIILFGKDFWHSFDEFVRNSLLEYNLITKGDELKYKITDDLDFIIQTLKEQL
ncbi:TIGR00730 family Rossman fold protein [Campylobacter novaezeelandiae]|uniref:Cytokinin riboside 5'-monophosphate phosphoribohydrolase n=1 Tax=Campylobacter novaezeelandiae TaxID=2267891 RepID=A0A4Q9JVF0_9BACT|nr:TIGR00730 family Rossman fold protein [Campylobacter novaezeelandiae]MBK1963526.1 TIGR00730 family Rossman fold protein [Campylobacter novaezeelandiae]MBK1992997.1 TIGR00730 family Rossman fold protein [Campylobacter novaezeelandiae]QWU79417.1 putative lysine decarboxylase family protein [Campylobacter novaezeelandiae]TBR79213.1 TIGR00730 family Rossman fold protein [Campylobacter novaezeelandiae]TBR80971.1 TIGR00730 family Rossman fold protein [Campylobacter novaezeelandiae]